MPPEALQPSTAPHPKRILIADDVPQVRHDLRQLLELTGQVIVVGEACNGAETVHFAKNLQPDVILIDVAMVAIAVMDGYEAISQVKELCPACRVIVLTAHDYLEVHQRATQAGADGFVTKGTPVDILIQYILNTRNILPDHSTENGSAKS